MKILIYGLQSSGASLFCYFMAQKPGSIGVVDLNNHRRAPRLDTALDVALKAVITTRWSLTDHTEEFDPDRKILFIRNPYNNYYSLKDKQYADKSGDIDEKFRLLETCFSTPDKFDQVISYEDFIRNRDETIRRINKLGWKLGPEAYSFPRTPQDIFLFNNQHSDWCRNNPAAPGPGGGWGMGNVSGAQIDSALSEKPFSAELDDKIRTLCPTLHTFYASRKMVLK